MTVGEQQDPTEPTTSKLVWVPIGIGVSLVLAYWIYFGSMRNAPAGGPDSWGQFGDFLGGLLNPVVGTITIVLLVRTLLAQERAIRLQTQELAYARHDFEQQLVETRLSTQALADQHQAIVKQSFEQAFFAWLQSYRQLVEGLQAQNVAGQRRLIHLVQPLLASKHSSSRSEVLMLGRNPPYAELAAMYLTQTEKNNYVVSRFESAASAYQLLYANEHSSLGPLLRTLYRLIDWIDGSSLSGKDKWHYIAIVRSQLSWAEMMILAYNGTTARGNKFVPLMEKYALLDNLDAETDDLVAVMREAFLQKKPESFPYTEATFNSTTAKSALGL
ncbi:putative phage abortive infection protein [Achromobacter mucicolens]|uniref:putative phage abortive infection protein n=1 Tax=Achromobacter mucicolens TaxID=1389922 RepID=UPI003B9B82BF